MTLQHLRHPTRRSAAVAIAALALLASAAQADTVTIDFDLLPSGDFASGAEDGFTLDATGAQLVGLAGLVTGFSAPNYIAADSSGNWVLTLVESDGSDFEFLGLAGAGASSEPGVSASLTVRGFQGAGLVGTDIFTVVGSAGQSFNASALTGLALTRVEIEGQFVSGEGISAFADNIRLETDATVVPIPAAAWLFGSALFGIVGLGYRNRKQSAA